MLKNFITFALGARSVVTLVASTIALSLTLSNTAQALSFDQISQVYFFGDSLTDSGFNDLYPEAQPGKAPTFTTYGGYIWSQYVARDIKGYPLPVYPNPTDKITNNSIEVTAYDSGTLNGINYAASGSTTNAGGVVEYWAPSLHQQISYFLSPGQALDPNAVYFVWSGANDFLNLLLNSPTLPTQPQLLLTANLAANNIANYIALLSSRGAKRIVVMSLPNLGVTPLINSLAVSTGMPTLPAQMSTLSFTFNSMLNQLLGKVTAQYGTKILYIDTYTLINNAIRATQAGVPYYVGGQPFVFVNYTTPACGLTPAISCLQGSPNNYIFADTLHPTDQAHRLLAAQVEMQILNWS